MADLVPAAAGAAMTVANVAADVPDKVIDTGAAEIDNLLGTAQDFLDQAFAVAQKTESAGMADVRQFLATAIAHAKAAEVPVKAALGLK